MKRTGVIVGAAAALCLALGAGPAGAQDFKLREIVRGSVSRSLPLLQSTAQTFVGQVSKDCFSCHHQSLPVMTVALAKERGFQVDDARHREQVEHIYSILAPNTEMVRRALDGDPETDRKVAEKLINPNTVLGYALVPLLADGRKADETLATHARYLMTRQAEDGRWPSLFARPPMEGSDFTATALAIRAINGYVPKEQAGEAAARTERARQWLLSATARTTEDRAFRLFGLRWANASPAEIAKAARELMDEQRDDGGWAQLPSLGSDPYATGLALVALHQAGGIGVTEPVYLKGSGFLVGTQKEDGSWQVQKRTPAFQPYFESGFPHGKDQFISCGATAWATMALTLLSAGLEPPAPAAVTATR